MNKNLKYILIPALAGILFASCNTEPTGPSAAELDTQVEAKVKEASDKMKADCDMQIMNAASMKKDSILMQMVKAGKMKPSVINTNPKTTTPPRNNTPKVEPVKTEPVKTEPVKEKAKGLKGLSDQNKAEEKAKGLKGLSDQNKAEEKAESGNKGGLKGLKDKK